MRYRLSELKEYCRSRPGLWQQLLASGRLDASHGFIDLDAALPEGPAPAPMADPKPLLRSDWPVWARLLAELSRPGDLGVGDVAARLAGAVGLGSISAFMKSKGWNCGCDARREWMNSRYPLAAAPRPARGVTAGAPPALQ